MAIVALTTTWATVATKTSSFSYNGYGPYNLKLEIQAKYETLSDPNKVRIKLRLYFTKTGDYNWTGTNKHYRLKWMYPATSHGDSGYNQDSNTWGLGTVSYYLAVDGGGASYVYEDVDWNGATHQLYGYYLVDVAPASTIEITDCYVYVPLPTPTTPTVSAAASTANSNTVTYGTTSFGTVGSGTVYLYGGTASAPTTQLTSKTTVGNSSYNHTGLAANTKYYYRSRAYSTAGWSSYSTETSQITKPAAATVSISSYNASSITISYSVAANGGAATQTLEYKVGSGNWTTAKTITGGSATSGTFTISGLTSNTAYSIATRMTNSAGSTTGSTLSGHTALAPSQGSVSGSNTNNTTNSVTYGVTSFGYPTTGVVYLYGSTSDTSSYSTLQTKTTTGNTTFTHNNLTPNTRYYYKCSANNSVLTGTSSSDVAVVTRPAGGTASISSYNTTSITVAYTVNADGGFYDKTLQYTINGGTSYTAAATISGASASSGTFTISGLTPGTTYNIGIRVATTAGTTAITTLTQKTASAPTGLTVTVGAKTWNTVALTGSISSYGYPDNLTGRYVSVGVNPAPLPTPITNREVTVATNATSGSGTLTNSSWSGSGGPFTLCGCVGFYPYVYATNLIASTSSRDTSQVYYLPPAPLATLSLTSLTHTSDYVTAVFSVAGSAADGTNNAVGALVNTEYCYAVGEGAYSAWTQIGTSEAPNTAHSVTLSNLPFDTTVTVKARQVFSGEYSEVKTLSFTTEPKPNGMYGSVSGESRPVVKAYGSVNGQTKLIIKGYGSVGGVTKRIY